MSLRPPALILVALAACLGILGQWADAAAFPWWRLVAALLVAGLLYEMLRLRGRRPVAAADLQRALHLGRREEIRLGITNPLPGPLTLRFAPGLPAPVLGPEQATELTLAAETRAEVRLPVRALELGQHAWQALAMRIRGPLGLAWWPVNCPLDGTIAVQPDILGRGGHGLGTAAVGGATQRAVGAGDELNRLRNYQPGDPLHTVDWKATARMNRLITRVFNRELHLEIMLVLDAGRTSRTEIDGMSQLGHYVNLSARFAEYAADNQDHVGLLAFADEPLAVVAPGRGALTTTRIRRALGALAPQPRESDVLKAALELRRLVRQRCLVILLSDLYEGTADGRLAQAARLWVPKHLPMVVGLVGEDLKLRSNMISRGWLDPYRSLAARDYRRHLDSGVDSLRRLGAHAIVARPAELDDQVFAHYRLLKAQGRV